MASGMTAFLVAVGGTSLICYLLNQVQNRSARRQSAGSDGSGNDVSYSSGGDGWNIFSWFSGDSSSSDNLGASGDSGGGSDSGGGDSGGGGGGGD